MLVYCGTTGRVRAGLWGETRGEQSRRRQLMGDSSGGSCAPAARRVWEGWRDRFSGAFQCFSGSGGLRRELDRLGDGKNVGDLSKLVGVQTLHGKTHPLHRARHERENRRESVEDRCIVMMCFWECRGHGGEEVGVGQVGFSGQVAGVWTWHRAPPWAQS